MGMTPEEHSTLVVGVPAWMREDMRAWLHRALIRPGAQSDKDLELVMDFDRRSRQKDPLAGEFRKGWNSLEQRLYVDDDIYTSFLDFLIWQKSQDLDQNRGLLDELDLILESGGSMWTVGSRNLVAGLEHRVPQGVQDAAEAALATPGDAGRLLSEAWHAVYGQNPQPDLGYRKSIEAVEALVLPKVMPKDDTATLGKAIGQMRTDGDWKLPFIKEHKQNPSQDVVQGMLQALWSGHSDRHPGTASYIQSSQEAAEAAVSLAVTLVNLFANGGIARRP